jgi:hypothetical protein
LGDPQSFRIAAVNWIWLTLENANSRPMVIDRLNGSMTMPAG